MPSTDSDGGHEVVTWHYGLIARWWADFNLDGPEIDYFGESLTSGQPALDAACGTGRLLAPWVSAGHDIDGVDVSASIARCREAAERVGRSPTLYVQPAAAPPRHPPSIPVHRGGFGLGTSREQDVEALRRLFAHLKPGGLLVLDYEVEEFDAEWWRTWTPVPLDPSPPEPVDRRLGLDGFEYALRHRLVSVNHHIVSRRHSLQSGPAASIWAVGRNDR